MTRNRRYIYIYIWRKGWDRSIPLRYLFFFHPYLPFSLSLSFFIFRTLLPSTHAHTHTLSLPFSLISLGFLTRPIFVGARRVFPDRSHVNFRRSMTRQSLGPQTWRCRGGMGEDVWWNFLRTAEHRKWKDLRVDHKVQRTEGGCRLLGLSNRDSEFGIRWKLGIPRGRKFFDWKKRIGHCGKLCEICGKTPLFFSISFNNSRFILIQSKIIIR